MPAEGGTPSFRPQEDVMTYKVFTGPPGSPPISPLEKDRWLYKEFADLDQALAWAQHAKEKGLVPLLIEGDDGTHLDKYAVANALQHREHESASQV
jgi:hypothetical protein